MLNPDFVNIPFFTNKNSNNRSELSVCLTYSMSNLIDLSSTIIALLIACLFNNLNYEYQLHLSLCYIHFHNSSNLFSFNSVFFGFYKVLFYHWLINTQSYSYFDYQRSFLVKRLFTCYFILWLRLQKLITAISFHPALLQQQ